MTKSCANMKTHVCECAHVQATEHPRRKRKWARNYTFCWYLYNVTIWKPSESWQIDMSAQACQTWPHWAWVSSVNNRIIDIMLMASFPGASNTNHLQTDFMHISHWLKYSWPCLNVAACPCLCCNRFIICMHKLFWKTVKMVAMLCVVKLALTILD